VNTKDVLDQRINEEGGVTVASSCADDFTVDDTAWVSSDGTAGISVVPPTSLFNDYYECYNTVTKSALIAFGAGSGSAGSITPAFVMFCVLVVGRFLVRKTNEAAGAINDAAEAINDAIHDYMGVPHSEKTPSDQAAIEMTWNFNGEKDKEPASEASI